MLAITPTIMATAARKLENDEVRAIFESLHDNKPPPPGLNFQIVPVDSDGLRLSPPAHEYEGQISVQLVKISDSLHFLLLTLFLFFRWNLCLTTTGQVEEKEEKGRTTEPARKTQDPPSPSSFENENPTV